MGKSSQKSTSFASLSLKASMLKNLEDLGYQQMTAIQAESLPLVLDGKDVIAQAKTGSGKTAAFGIGLLSHLDVKRFRVQALVICPTRELADQVSKELRRLARFTQNVKILSLCGGTPFGPQLGSLEHGVHVVVGTPGRLQEHLRKQSLNLDELKVLVLDEADRMLDMGFEDAIDDVIAKAPSHRQTLLFSATYPDSILTMSERVQYKPVTVTVESIHSNSQLEQHFYEVEKSERLSMLAKLLGHYQPASTLIFCNTKRECQAVADDLVDDGFSALAIHGDLDQKDRNQVLVRFSNKSCSILVATDVAARGLDISDLEAVINYELSRDPEVHIHRIGRTGRAGNKGLALSLYTASEAYRLSAIEDYLKTPLSIADTSSLSNQYAQPFKPPMVTLCIDGGRKNKMRPGDLLGALTGDAGVPGKDVGKIDVFDFHTYVAIARASATKALTGLREGKVKGRTVKVRKFK